MTILSSRPSRKVGVIGAGPAGLTAAYSLLKKGCDVTVFEKDGAVGGMAKTIELWGRLVDLGPHRFFSSDPRVNLIWLEAIGEDYQMVSRQTRIYYQNTFFDYPLKAFNAFKGLGAVEAARCLLSYLSSKVFPIKDETSFEAWVTNRFGARLFSIFFKSYSEKLWGISCRELDAYFAAQRIKKLSLFEAIKAAVIGNSGQHRTLADEFAYPNHGAGAVYERMADKIRSLGGRILMNTSVADVRLSRDIGEKPRVLLSGGQSFDFDHLVSSMPIDELLGKGHPEEILRHVGELRFRNTILVYLLLEGENPFPDQWIYVHSPDLKTGRISNFRNWLPSICRGLPGTIICLEYWCYEDDPLWRGEEAGLIEQAAREIYATGLVQGKAVKGGKVLRISKCYPVYDSGYRNHLEPVKKYLSSLPGLSVIGRYGAFKYNNQDHSILMGLLAAENIADERRHDLWQINTDYEYQESSRITATGLGKVSSLNGPSGGRLFTVGWMNAFLCEYEGFAKYFFASALSLAVDYVSYILLVKCGGLALPAAAALGYSIGLVFAYLLISRKVFVNGWLREFRKTEFMLFLISGAIGVGLTYGTSFMVVTLLGNMLNTAKLASVVVSFICVYIFRKFVVFRARAFYS